MVKIQKMSRSFLAATVKWKKKHDKYTRQVMLQPTEKPLKHNAVMTEPIPTSLMFHNVSHTFLDLLSFVAPHPNSKEN